ncbi:MAG: hypothetical protein KIS88_05775 [Anaerolineales bacterium]|nr:hypothetical protein [Anaerolineales bacterium]
MTLNRLFIFHALVTLAAGIALVVVPNAIPSTVGVKLDEGQFIIAYLLAGAEFGVAYLSFVATRISDHGARRAIVLSFIVFHMTTAILEVYANLQGLSPLIWANVALRVLISALFTHFGLRQSK